MIKNVYWSSHTQPAFKVGFQLDLNFLDEFSKYKPNFMKIQTVETELFHADRRR